MAIGEAFLSAFLQVLFDRLASNEFMGILFGKSYDELLEKLKITLLTVTALLGDAEEKQFHSTEVVRWLHAARDGMFDAEDLLDELATEALKCHSKLESWNSLTARVSSTLTPTSSSGKSSIESRLRKVIERLEIVAKYKNVLGLRERVGDGSGTGWRLVETTSLVDEGSVLGSDGEKEAIVAALLAEEGKCDVGVVPIVGMGGIGKTTLAQLAYNDERVVGRFEIRVWVCVSERFDPVRVTRTILGSGGSRSDADDRDEGFDSIQVRLKEKLEGKRFLVVFDDVWGKRNGDWDRLWEPLRSGKRGSKAIVTTRNADVAASLGTVPAHRLGRLSDRDCWAVFSRQMSESGSVVPLSLKSAGQKIAERCEGLPMAAKRLGILLRSRSREDDWNDVSRQRIWDSPSDESDILRILSPTYLHLPSHLKQCFAFFAVFPPKHEYDKSSLVAMWMSEGFLWQPKGKKRLEEVGDEYFRELVSRSILEPSVDNPSKYVVHGLLKELADFVAGDFCFRLEESSEDGIFEKARHSSYVRGNRDEMTRFKAFERVKHLRTFLPLDPMIDNIGVSYLADNVPRELLPKLRYLRVLSFSSCRLTKLPNSIGNLKHLRYLNLSRTAIKVLPESTNELYNLQTLELSQCRYLTKLPSKMGNLKSLRSLFISGTRLREMPLEICELRNLQKLSNFVVGENSGSGIKDLGRLSQLCGSLQISGLENVGGFIDAMESNMKEKRELSRLVFQWNSFNDSCTDEPYEEEVTYFPQHRDVRTRGYKSKRFPTFRETVNEYDHDSAESEHGEDNPRDERNETLVLEMLQPHTNIKRVTIRGYGGTTFPKWIESPLFSHIRFLKLSNCKKCTNFPAIGQLPSLEDLVLEGMEKVKRIGVEFYGDEQPFKSPFSSLKTLKFDNMTSLEEWLSSGGEDFPRLEKIEMQNCPKIRIFPIGLGFPRLLELSIWACPNLKELPGSFPSLTMLEIDGCRDMTKLPDLLSIRDLELSNCDAATVKTIPRLGSLSYLRLSQIPNLARLSHEFFENLRSLEELHIADMSGLVDLANLRKIRSLERMEISGCTILEELPRSLSEFSALSELRVWACPKLASFAATTTCLPSTLKGLEIRDCESLQSLPDLKSSSSLEYLIIEGCSSITSLPWDELPITLKELEIQDCERLESITKGNESSNENTSLEILTIACCRSITGINFPGFNLKELTVQGCPSLTRLPDGLCSLTHLEISDCPALVKFHESETPGSRAWAALRTIKLSNLLGLESLPARMNALPSLEALCLESCPNVGDIPEGGLPVSLVSLSVLNCENLRPSFRWGLHRLTRLAELVFGGCGGLREFPDDWLLPNSLSSLQFQRLPSLQSLPRGLENLSELANLEVWGCDNLRTDKDQLSMLQKFDLWNVL